MKAQHLLFIASGSFLANFSAIAQTPNIPLPPGTRERVEETIPTPIPAPSPLPSSSDLPSLQFPIPDAPTAPSNLLSEKIDIKTIQVKDNTVLNNEIQAIIQRYEGQTITFEQLLQLRSQITALYTTNGFVSSGVFIPSKGACKNKFIFLS